MSILQKITEKLTKFTNKYLSKTGDEYLELKYGISIIVINTVKITSIILIAFILGIGKYLVTYFLAFALIRLNAFGVHASKSIKCTFLNFTVFIGGTYLALALNMNNHLVISIFLVSIFILYIYAPSPTKKRPIVSRPMIKRCKRNSIITAFILMVITILILDNKYKGSITLGVFSESIFITPLMYNLLGEDYKG